MIESVTAKVTEIIDHGDTLLVTVQYSDQDSNALKSQTASIENTPCAIREFRGAVKLNLYVVKNSYNMTGTISVDDIIS